MSSVKQRAASRAATARYAARYPEVGAARAKRNYVAQKKLGWPNLKHWYSSHPEAKLLNYVRCTAGNKGLVCNLVKGDIIIPKRCPVLGIPLFFTPGRRTDNTPSVDRIDNSKGYLRSNIAVVSWRANNRKGDLTRKEIGQMYRFYVRRRS